MSSPIPLPAQLTAEALLRNPIHSTYREKVVETALLSELRQDAWFRRGQTLEVLRADMDVAGHDIVLGCGRVTRHIQLKSSVVGGRTEEQNVNVALAHYPAGCVVWVVLELGPDLRLRMSYLAFGGKPHERLPDIDAHPVARHTKANAEGEKKERPNIRTVRRSSFETLTDAAALNDWLFGPPPA